MNPKPNLFINAPAAVCSPLTIDLTSAAVTATSNLEGGVLSYFSNSAVTNLYATPTVANSGTYYILATTAQNCTDTAQVNVIVNSLPVIDVKLPSDICYDGGNVNIEVVPNGGTLSGTGVTTEQFNPKDGGLVIDQSSYVYYEYRDGNNCTNKDSTLVILRIEPVVTPMYSDTSICVEEEVTLSATSDIAADLEWNYYNSRIGSGNSVQVNNGGVYTVKATTAYCASQVEIVNVTVLNPSVEASIEPGNPIKEGEFAQLNILNFNSEYTYQWKNEETGEEFFGANWVVSPKKSTEFSLEAFLKHCSTSVNLELEVRPLINIPNVFTPNGDGEGDSWIIEGLNEYPFATVRIYNRWGLEMYQTNGGYEEPWDGMHNGNPVPDGTYYYVINLIDGSNDSFAGNVIIIR